MSYVLTMYDLEVLANPNQEYWCPVIEIQENEKDQVHDALISYAALMRVNDDLNNSFKIHEENSPSGVGTIEYNGTKKPLTLREACNKVIHASSYEWELSYSHDHPLYPLYSEDLYKVPAGKVYKRPILKLEGKLFDKPWIADVNFLMFVLFYSASNNT